MQPGETTRERRLAASGFAKQGDTFPRPDDKVDVLERLMGSELHLNMSPL